MAKFQIEMPVEHAILFLSDPAVEVSIPPDTGASVVTTTADCICFWVAPDVDGDARVTISDQPCEQGERVFSGTVLTPSRVLSLTDSSVFTHLNLPVSDAETNIDIWMDDPSQPDWAWVKLPINFS